MHVSEFDNRYGDQEETWHNWVLANERMAAALKAKGYKYQYVYSRDSRHVDPAVVAQTLPKRSSGCGGDIRDDGWCRGAHGPAKAGLYYFGGNTGTSDGNT